MSIINDVFTISEASKLWQLDQKTLLCACKGQKGYPPRFTSDECRQSARHWLITRAGMIRLYGVPKVDS